MYNTSLNEQHRSHSLDKLFSVIISGHYRCLSRLLISIIYWLIKNRGFFFIDMNRERFKTYIYISLPPL